MKATLDRPMGAEVDGRSAWPLSGIAGIPHLRPFDGLAHVALTSSWHVSAALYTVERNALRHSFTSARSLCGPQNMSRSGPGLDPDKPWEGESRESILAKRRARRLVERLAKPAYVNTDACCRFGRAALAYESARMGKRAELTLCSDSTLAEHLALLMAMHDADSKLTGRVVFRVDSAEVIGESRGDRPELGDAKRQIDALLLRHQDWRLVLVDRERNKQAHHLAQRTLREG